MAWFNNNNNGGYNSYGYGGGAGTYPDHEHRPMIMGPDHGPRHSIVGYSESSYNEQRYSAQTEKVVQYRHGPTVSDYRMSSPKKEVYKDHGERDKPFLARWGSTHDQPEKRDGFSPKGGNIAHRVNNPRSKDQYHSPRGYGKFNTYFNDESDDHDYDYDHNEKIKESDYSSPPYNVPLSNTPPRKETNYYDTPYRDEKGNGYTAPPYALPTSNNHPKLDQSYEKGYKDNNIKDYKENDYDSLTYTVPMSNTPPKRDNMYYETPNNKPIATRLAPIKTRNDKDRNGEFVKNNSPMAPQRGMEFSGSPRNSPKIIDSAEARRRYGKGASPMAGAFIEEKFTGIIDSREAARRYNGVFLPN